MCVRAYACACACVGVYCVYVWIWIGVECTAQHKAFELGECNFGLRTKLTIFQMFEKLQLNPNNTLIQMLTQNEMKRYKFIISLLLFSLLFSPPLSFSALVCWAWVLFVLTVPSIYQSKTHQPVEYRWFLPIFWLCFLTIYFFVLPLSLTFPCSLSSSSYAFI